MRTFWKYYGTSVLAVGLYIIFLLVSDLLGYREFSLSPLFWPLAAGLFIAPTLILITKHFMGYNDSPR